MSQKNSNILIEGKEYNPMNYVGLTLKPDTPGGITAKIEMFFDCERPFFLLRNTETDEAFCDHADYVIFLIEESKSQ